MAEIPKEPNDDPDGLPEPEPSDLDELLEKISASTPNLLSDVQLPDLEHALLEELQTSRLESLEVEAGSGIDELDQLLSAALAEQDDLREIARRIAQEREDRLETLLAEAVAGPDAPPEEPLPEPDPNVTAQDVARWMQQEVEAHGVLFQESAVYHIMRHFGTRFSRNNENGNPAIAKDVLREFRRLTTRTIVWVWLERYWRERRPGDPPGRRVE